MLWCFAIATALTISAFRVIRLGGPAVLQQEMQAGADD